MYFLPTKHSHADIDQSLSAMSSHLRKNDAINMDDILCKLQKCYKKRVPTANLLRVSNFLGLCGVSNCLRCMKGVKFSRLRFRKITTDIDAVHGCLKLKCLVKIQECSEWEPFTRRPNAFRSPFQPLEGHLQPQLPQLRILWKLQIVSLRLLTEFEVLLRWKACIVFSFEYINGVSIHFT